MACYSYYVSITDCTRLGTRNLFAAPNATFVCQQTQIITNLINGFESSKYGNNEHIHFKIKSKAFSWTQFRLSTEQGQ